MRHHVLSLAAALFMVIFSVPSAFAQGGRMVIIRPPDAPRPASPVQLETRVHQVDVVIDGQVASTTVEQVFFNPSNQRLEGHFLFPVPADSVVEKFTMDINGKATEAELLDADKAREIYENIVRQMRDPALLEFAGHQLLKARIFPIEPNSETRITLHYKHILAADAGTVRYVYPLRGRTVQGQTQTPLSVKVQLRTHHPLTTVYSPSHQVEVVRQGNDRATVGMETAQADGSDFTLYYATERDAKAVSFQVLTFRDQQKDPMGSDAGYFLMLLSPGSLAANDKPLPKDIVFVLDTSGSMAGGKLDQAKRAMIFCLENLNDEDRFEMIRFSTEVEPVFGSLRDADADARQEARKFVETLRPIGGTAIDAALEKALQTLPAIIAGQVRPRIVVFLTDGRPTIGKTDADSILSTVKNWASNTRVFSFGIGHDVNTHLLDRVSEQTRAVSEYVLPDEDIELKVSRFYGKIADPVLANLKLTPTAGNGIRLTSVHPVELPDLFKGDQLILLGRYEGSGKGEVTLTGQARDQAMTFTREAAFAERDENHRFIPRLWATRRVGYLLDQMRLHGSDNRELRDEIAALGRAFNIITPQTSYLILEDEDRRRIDGRRGTVLRSTARPEEQAAQRMRLNQQVEALQERQSGDTAVKSAQSAKQMRGAGSLKDLDESSARYFSAVVPNAEPGQATVSGLGRTQTQAQTRHVQGRTFVQHGRQWVDTTAQQLGKDVKPQRIAFGSDAYFELLHQHPEAAQWLALGREVQVVLDGQLYEIYDTEERGDGAE